MKYALPLSLFATPALAHSGAHAHPHGAEGWIALFLLAGIGLTVWVRR